MPRRKILTQEEIIAIGEKIRDDYENRGLMKKEIAVKYKLQTNYAALNRAIELCGLKRKVKPIKKIITETDHVDSHSIADDFTMAWQQYRIRIHSLFNEKQDKPNKNLIRVVTASSIQEMVEFFEWACPLNEYIVQKADDAEYMIDVYIDDVKRSLTNIEKAKLFY